MGSETIIRTPGRPSRNPPLLLTMPKPKFPLFPSNFIHVLDLAKHYCRKTANFWDLQVLPFLVDYEKLFKRFLPSHEIDIL